MSCFHPITAYRMDNQTKLSFRLDNNAKLEKHRIEQLQVPCGKCIGCLLDRSNDMATRIHCETQNWTNNCFITLTYNNEHLPKDAQLCKKDLQDFWKRLRYYHKGVESWENPRTGKTEQPIRYYACGEYGENPKDRTLTPYGRPHYHACVFNWRPKDLKFYKTNHQGDALYTSKELNKIWGKGYVVVGNLNYQSACYVARYVTKKLFGKIAKIVYENKKPEFTESSRSVGIGLLKWLKDKIKIKENKGIYIKIKDKVKLKKIPKYFMKKWKEENALEYDWHVFEQTNIAKKNKEKVLAQTSLSESEYLKLQEKNLIEKIKCLKRSNII